MKKIFISLIACALCLVSAQAQEMLYLNGDVVPLKDVVRMTTRRVKRSDFRQLLEKDQSIAIYTEALNATGIMDTLSLYVDMTYKWNSEQDRIDSFTWTNDKLCIPVAKDANGGGGEYDNVAYPEKRYYNWTVFMCPDSVLEQKYGVTKVLGRDDYTSLEYLAHSCYDPMYPEDAAASGVEVSFLNNETVFIKGADNNVNARVYSLSGQPVNAAVSKTEGGISISLASLP